MAANTNSPLRHARTPGRTRRTASVTEAATEPPNKRRRFHTRNPSSNAVNGDDDDFEEDDKGDTTVSHLRSSRATRTAPRSRPRRSHLANGHRTLGQTEEGETPSASRSAMQTRPRRERPARYVPPMTTPRPRYSNAAAAAAASQASDGYKPREERSWEDFHPDLDVDAEMMIFTADEVDGRTNQKDPRTTLANILGEKALANGEAGQDENAEVPAAEPSEIVVTPMKRKPGRPPRRPESMLHGLGSPPAPRIIPLPTHNPKERLNLPKPSFRHYNHYLQYEEDQKENKANYVDRTMAHVGYQETDRYELPSRVLVRWTEAGQVDDEHEVGLRLESDGPTELAPTGPVIGKVEYDMDEQDVNWLEELNVLRKSEGVDIIKPAIFEITMTQIEKEYHALEKRIPKPQPRHAQMQRPRSSSQAAVNGDPGPAGADEPDSKCAICDDGDCENANAIIFCDGCDLAVHQECYGVPFIPEGQWFCRKCKEIGRGTPTCIFCPNVDGAFKQTNTLRWSHLLCAIFIPEVTVSNMTFMEPITDVERVPKSRWKLHCYICNQKMGACIQCGNKNCYQAFHVSCARKAKLFLRMKSPYQQGLDTTALKAFCDKHVPPEWRRTHDTDTAIVEAKRWYRHTMKDRKWADSQTAALEMGAPPLADGGLGGENMADDTIAVSKRRKNQPSKTSWRLPSGAPVIPAAVFDTVEASLQRFTIRKRKEFVERACRYWTLKREARRGAALLKRLQLQLESFSSMEITRRNFTGMGAAGRPRLLRRIEFAEMLQKDMDHLTTLCSEVRQREQLRLKEVELLRELVDAVYFPVPALLAPILQRARKLDEKTKVFTEDFDRLALLLRERYYTSVQSFSHDLSLAMAKRLARSENMEDIGDEDIETIHSRLNEAKPGTAEHMALTNEQKDLKRLAKRIVKAVKEPLEAALKKEAALRGREMEEELRRLDSMGLFASNVKALEVDDEPVVTNGNRRSASDASEKAAGAVSAEVENGYAEGEDEDVEMPDVDEQIEDNDGEAALHLSVAGKDNDAFPTPNQDATPASKTASSTSSIHDHAHQNNKSNGHTQPENAGRPAEPLSPPTSTDDPQGNNLATNNENSDNANANAPSHPPDSSDFFTNGGVPWYLEPFDPHGTTIHDERYTGREILRDMSEELSDMDEDTLVELGANGAEGTPGDGNTGTGADGGFDEAIDGDGKATSGISDSARKKVPKRKGKRAQWSRRSRR